MSDHIKPHNIKTAKCDSFKVFVQGDLAHALKDEKKVPIFLTVHDIGKNHNSWLDFLQHPSMSNVRDKVVFVHVDLPGQEDGAKDLPEKVKFPSMQEIAEDLINILDSLKISSVIGMGDRAGANIMARFMTVFNKRCKGVVLVNPTANVAKMTDQFKEKLLSHFSNLHHSLNDYIILHRFGHKLEDIESDSDIAKTVNEYKHQLKTNSHNSNLYAEAFLARDGITDKLSNVKEHILIVCGAKSSFPHDMNVILGILDKAKVSSLKVDGVGDVLEEAPDKLANSLLVFCKSLGYLTNVTSSGARIQRKMSMEDYDKPNIARLLPSAVSDAKKK